MSDQAELKGIRALLVRKLKDTSGAAIALVALCMVALLSAVALAVDVGMMTVARTEMQLLVDAAALEGARELRDSQGDSAKAHDAAVAFGSANNTVRGDNVTILNQDVDVIPDEWTVRVRGHRTQDRGSAIPTFFARIFGVDEVDIRADASAWAVESSTIGAEDDSTCPALPLALLDRYDELNGEPGFQSPPDTVIGWNAQPDSTHGTLVRLKMQPSAEDEPYPVTNEIDYCNETATGSSWRCWWRTEDEDPNSPNISEKIRGEECTESASNGDDIYNASGNKQSNVHQDFAWLIEQDPDLAWCETCAENGCVSADDNTCYAGKSLRKRTVPIVDPTTINGSGSGINGNVIGFLGVFVERVAKTYAGNEQINGKMNVYLRLTIEGGSGSGVNEGENDPEALVRDLQLIE